MHYISTVCLKGENSKFTRDVFKVLDVYAKAGIKNIELGAAHQPFDNIKDLFKFKKEHDVNFIMHTNFPCQKDMPFLLNIASKNEKIIKATMEVIKKGVELSNDFESPVYSLHPGFPYDFDLNLNPINKAIPGKEVIDITIPRINKIMDFAKRYDMKIAMENMVEEVGAFYNADDFLVLFKKVNNKNFGILLDIGHMKVRHPDLEKQKDFVDKVRDRIFEMHLHEVVDGKDHLKLTNSDILKPFNLNVKNIALTLESQQLSVKDILKCREVLKKIACNKVT